MAAFRLLFCCVLLFFPHFTFSIPEPGKTTMKFVKDGEYRGFSKALYKDAVIRVKGKCSSEKKPKITISWKLKYSQCADGFFMDAQSINLLWDTKRNHELSGQDEITCNGPVHLSDFSSQKEYIEPPTQAVKPTAREAEKLDKKVSDKTNDGKPDKKTDKNTDDMTDDMTEQKTEKMTEKKTEKKTGDKSAPNETADVSGKNKRPLNTGKTQKQQRSVYHRSKRGEESQQTGEKENEVADQEPSKNVKTVPTKRKAIPSTKKANVKPAANPAKPVKSSTDQKVKSHPEKKKTNTNRIVTTKRDGIYMLIVMVTTETDEKFDLELEVSMESKSGYLSATDWPLLPFYGVMSLVYLFYGIVWLIISACQWRDLLRIQFWIGGVIALGMLEKAVFYSEYNNINNIGVPTASLVVFAEVVSVAKRTLARMLVIIVSMGFGIVKPRLGKSLHRVLGVGALYFILGVVEGSMRSLSLKADPSKQQLIAGIPLAVLDASICWWIFMSLVQTTRTLRIRRNVVKLSLYRHFTNTLIFAVLASVAYMIWSIKTHRFADCLKDWSELWLDEAFWHFLFSILLLVIMILWRPTANNQRYAFTPIVDFDDDDEEDNVTLSEAFDGMKMRNTRTEVVVNGTDTKKKAEDDLKWVEENIPSSAADTVLPSVLDSDEELMTTKFEMSKMD